MSITVIKRPAKERGRTRIGWLDSYHTFSFGEYYDKAHMGYHALRVINDDTVEPGQGFGTHPHRDMEILSYVTEGALEHKDSMGNGRVIAPGQLQYMSAGSGVFHSEFNPSKEARSKFLQIWIEPKERGGQPRYADMDTSKLKERDALALFASGDGRAGSVAIRQDAEVYFGHGSAGSEIEAPGDGVHVHNWLHVIAGEVVVGGERLGAGDGAAIEAHEERFMIRCEAESEFLLFRLA